MKVTDNNNKMYEKLIFKFIHIVLVRKKDRVLKVMPAGLASAPGK